MSLQRRLTLLYTSLVGGVLLLSGVAIYASVSVELLARIDTQLANTAEQILPAIRTSGSQISLTSFPPLDQVETVYIQLWSQDGRLVANNTRFNDSIDPAGLRINQTIYRTSTFHAAHLRILDVPLVVGERPVGILQVGGSLGTIDTTQNVLRSVLLISALISMAVVALGAWLSTGQALSRLKAVTEVATHITRADDLSRRIPVSPPEEDEVGQLIIAFNQTLSRLESLFNTQRRFLTDVSHELRTPLTVIKGNVGLLRKMGVTDEESLSGIEIEVDRLTRLVGDLLLLAQAESGKIPLDMRPVDLDTVLLEVYQQARVLAGDRLQVRIGEIDQVQVMGDRDRLKQVLINLVSNAIKYTPAGGQVILALSKSYDMARLVVSDTGPGIPTKDLPHIFERFYRAEKSRTRGRDGSSYGLGLSIAYWIVHHHGGRIEVESKEGHGTTFVLWLPLDKTTR
ncbi:MAG TPA: ATP-binding protein [Anaerolineaceae bacterium]|nr:ATP-binding protein [Anaerolineaceae bacterium]